MNLLAKKIKLHRCARIGGFVITVTHDALAARTGGGNSAQLLNRTLSCGLFPSCHLLK
jgi:hypothetical protein